MALERACEHCGMARSAFVGPCKCGAAMANKPPKGYESQENRRAKPANGTYYRGRTDPTWVQIDD